MGGGEVEDLQEQMTKKTLKCHQQGGGGGTRSPTPDTRLKSHTRRKGERECPLATGEDACFLLALSIGGSE